jgi:hypothetical protein
MDMELYICHSKKLFSDPRFAEWENKWIITSKHLSKNRILSIRLYWNVNTRFNVLKNQSLYLNQASTDRSASAETHLWFFFCLSKEILVHWLRCPVCCNRYRNKTPDDFKSAFVDHLTQVYIPVQLMSVGFQMYSYGNSLPVDGPQLLSHP